MIGQDLTRGLIERADSDQDGAYRHRCCATSAIIDLECDSQSCSW